MKNIRKILTVSAILGFLVLLAVPVSALAAGEGPLPGSFAGKGPRDSVGLTAHLDHLESLGYDISEIRAAAESGDFDTARTLLQQFMEEHKGELPAPPEGKGPGDGGRMTSHLDHFESLGYDVSEIRAAVESGDFDTARTLLQQFLEEHKDELPGPPEGKGPEDGGRITAPLDHLESLGYDVSEIRAAVESGDFDTARTLLQQFMEEHKDELPAPPDGQKTGNRGPQPPRVPAVDDDAGM